MESEAGSQPEKAQTDPDCLFEILEQDDPYNMKETCFLIKVVITKEMKGRMSDIEKNKKDRVIRLEQKEKTPEMIQLKERCDAIRKLDAKSFEEERKKNSGHNQVQKTLADYEHHQQLREKYSFSLFESFENRGRSPYIKFSYNPTDKHLSIRISKNYYLNELHLSRRDLFNIAISFTRTWEFDFHGRIRNLWRIYTENERGYGYNLFIRSLDLISVTFDVVYMDKRAFRFRYSPFEFRSSPTFKDDNQLTGYYQSVSCIPDINSTSTGKNPPISDSDFYSSTRLFFYDDLTDANIFYKILNRTNIVYTAYTISRGHNYNQAGNHLELDEFCKKSLGQFYFSTTRLKKIMFTWSFKQYKRANRDKKKQGENKEARDIILHIPFQMDKENFLRDEPLYRMHMQILDMTKVITYAVKEDLAYRVREWYLLVKEIVSREKTFFEAEKASLSRSRTERDLLRAEFQDFDIYVQFCSKDRFDKFFLGFLLLVSTVLDRHYFTLAEDKDRKREDSKIISIDTQETSYYSNKRQYIHHYHFLRLFFKHTYYPYMFYNSAREEDKKEFYNFLQNSRSSDYRLKCGEWKLQKIVKFKRKINIKNKEDLSDSDQAELTTFPDDFKRYIGILLRHFPLRLIYKDILSFVEAVCKTCYTPQQEANLMSLNGYDYVLRLIINVLLQEHYYSQFKDKQMREKEKEKQHDKDKEERSNSLTKDFRTDQKPELEYTKRDKAEDQFSKVILVKIISRQDVGFMAEDKLLFEVTFKLLEFKGTWITRIKEGSIVLRIFEDRLETERDYVIVNTFKGDMRNKKTTDEAIIKSCLQACLQDPKISTL